MGSGSLLAVPTKNKNASRQPDPLPSIQQVNLYEREAPTIRKTVFYVALRVLGPNRATDAEDVAQTSMLTALRRLGTFEGEGAELKAWVCRMSFYTALYFRRAPEQRRTKKFCELVTIDKDTGEEKEFDIEAKQTGAQKRAEWSQYQRALNVAMKDLSDDERNLLLMHHDQELSAPEIAQILDIKPDAVRTRLKRTRAKLEKKMAVFLPKVA